MTAHVLVSIIIPAYNAQATLSECLQACLKQTHSETEVIVIDDGSTDHTPRIAETFPVHYVRQENRGPAAARNHGARIARGETIAYTDADCVPEPNWIEVLLEGFTEGTEGTVAVGGTYTIANPSSALARMVHEEIAMRHARFGEEVDFLGSFNVAFKKDTFDDAGGFDEAFPVASAEDNDLAYRLRDAGGILRFQSHARVAHYHPTRLWPYLRTQMGHGFWRMRLYAKHPGRARKGDQYAGAFDFAAPPLSLLIFVSLPLLAGSAFFAQVFPWIAACMLGFAGVYAAIQAPRTARMVRRTGDPRMVLFAAVAAMRDVARALGMVRGIWTFLILKKAHV